MTTAASFNAPASGRLYYAQTGEGLRTRRDLRTAYRPPAGSTTSTALSIAESWALGGIYLFLGASITDEGRFLRRLDALLAGPAAGVRLLWLQNPNDSASAWIFMALRVAHDNQGGWRTRLTMIELRNYGLLLEGGCTVAFDDSLAGLRITPPPDRRAAISLTIGYDTSRLPLANAPLTIALAGDRAGRLAFGLVLRGKQSDPTAWHAALDQLDIGPRFFYQDAEYPEMG